jgi:hypothetical protein
MLPSEVGSVPRIPPEGKRSDRPPRHPRSLILKLGGGSIQARKGGSILASAEAWSPPQSWRHFGDGLGDPGRTDPTRVRRDVGAPATVFGTLRDESADLMTDLASFLPVERSRSVIAVSLPFRLAERRLSPAEGLSQSGVTRYQAMCDRCYPMARKEVTAPPRLLRRETRTRGGNLGSPSL